MPVLRLVLARCWDSVRCLPLAACLLWPALGLSGCGGDPEPAPVAEADPAAAPEAPPEPEPYVAYLDRRQDFRTQLVKMGPAPQPFEQEMLPEGVTEVVYSQVPAPGLKAWVQRPSPPSESPDAANKPDWTTFLATGNAAASDHKFPALVFFHGGFALGADDLAACRPFLDAGFVVMAPMLRGENGNPGHFELFLGEIDDAKAAVTWLSQQPYVDARKIFAFGHSVGGGVAALLTLLDRVPVFHTGSSGGLYDVSVFESWTDKTPFDTADAKEKSLRILLGNIQDMRRAHHAYIGQEDAGFEAAIQAAEAEKSTLPPPEGAPEPGGPPLPELKIIRVPGDHLASFAAALTDYLVVVQQDLLTIDAVHPPSDPSAAPVDRPLPQDVATWTDGDLKKAVEQNSPQLESAVQALTTRLIGLSTGPAAFEKFAAAVEATPDGAQNPNDGSAPAPPLPQRVMRAAIRGLADADSPAAWEMLGKLAQQNLAPSVDRRLMQRWVLMTTFERYQGPGHPSHDLVQSLSGNPESEAARDTIRILSASALDQLLGYPSDEGVHGSLAAGPMRAENAAQYPLTGLTMQGPDPNDSGLAPADGFQAGSNPAAGALRVYTQPLSAEAAQKAGVFFWQPQVAGALTSGIKSIPSMDLAGELIALSGACPRQDVRTALYASFDAGWTQGAERLIARGLFTSAFRDPGLLVVLKSLPRTMPTGPLPQLGPNSPKTAFETRAKATWMYASAQMALALNERLSRAVKQSGTRRSPHFEGFAAPKLHRDARVAGTLTLTWPEDLEGSPLAGLVSPLKLHYIHIEEEGNPALILQHYKSQMSRAGDYAPGGMRWLDQLQAGSTPGSRRSIDILFTAPRPAIASSDGAAAAQASGKYNIDILVVEIPDPKPARGGN